MSPFSCTQVTIRFQRLGGRSEFLFTDPDLSSKVRIQYTAKQSRKTIRILDCSSLNSCRRNRLSEQIARGSGDVSGRG